MKFPTLVPLAAAALLTFQTAPRADEGMWLYNNPPRQQLKDKYGFELTDAWLEHLQKSSVRFNSGGSGSFVSEDGLVISNHHVGADALQKVGSKEKNYLHDGFYAKTAAEELPCVDLELNVLQSIEDVTARVNAAVPAEAAPADAFKARRKVISEIEKESLEKTGLRSNVITLYQGGAYHLYRFKRYTDVRLVFAPEQQIAFYGGDPDNFEFPRFDLDICLFRVYEDGKPVKVQHYLKWSKAGVADGELTFVSGHPGHTDRLLTTVEMEYLRDVQFPYMLSRLRRLDSLLTAWSGRSEENARRAREDFFGVQNSRKAREGGIAGLQDPVLMGKKAAAERAFRTRLAVNGEFPEASAAYDKIAAAQGVIQQHALRFRLLEGGNGFSCESYGIARTLLRAGDERPKPNGERLREFTDSETQSLELALFSDKPIYEDYETLRLADSLAFLVEQLGFNDPLVQQVLAGKSPRERAAELIRTTKVRDVAFRKKLYEGGAAAVAAAKDPLIEVARLVDGEARELRKTIEAQDEVKQQAQAAIARARFKLEGTGKYPDATFTLRLSYGPVMGYDEGGGKVPAITTMAGLYQRSAEMKDQPPFDLPARWVKKKDALNLSTPLNFVSTADIIGGNSGSPVVNRAGEFVGIIFDGNLQSLVLDFAYDDVQARAVSVHSSAIIEALNKVYGVKDIVRELQTGKKKG
ncbi:MAG TPA: S46 family peptidase [Candidatus Limnocylindria bacterium]|nr:S46 family peptidase [Candidatus Limnocylindria bacterium]